MSDDRWDENWWGDIPIILGQGSVHDVSPDAGQVYGKKGARIRVRPKRYPIGFRRPDGGVK